MSDVKYTPGPWLYRPDQYDDWGIVKGADGFVVCQARDARYLDDKYLNKCRANKSDPWEANARLIAAAPELLEAVTALMFEKIDYMDRNNLGNPEEQHTVKMARAAIAKAKGEG